MAKSLREALEDLAGEEELEFIIPHPVLPPRFQDICEDRNMILTLDMDFTIHVRWEGARRNEWLSLTPGGTRRLVREVLRNLTKYRRDLQTYGQFLDRVAEQPFDDPRSDDSSSRREPPIPELIEEEEEPTEVVARVDLPRSPEMGGESPMPMQEEWM